MPSDTSISDLEAFATHLAKLSAEHTLRHFRSDLAVENKRENDWDPVTVADRDAEMAIRQQIVTSFPDHGIIGEEFGQSPGTSFTWILDPVDGTRAYVAGIPTWATLIGLYRDGIPLLGVMYQPYVDEIFVGHSGMAYSNYRGQRRTLQSRSVTGLQSACVGTTTPHLYTAGKNAEALETLRARTRMLRYGGDAYFFAMVAAGQLDLAIDPRLNIYDIAALIPIIEGAGGCIACWDGSPANEGGDIIAAGSRHIMEEACAVLNGLTK